MARLLYKDKMPSKVKTYKTYEGARSEGGRVIGDLPIPYLIVATVDGRFMPVAIGNKAVEEGLHFHMAVASAV